MENNSQSNKKSILPFAMTLSVIALVAIIGFVLLRPSKLIIEGQAEAPELRISSKVPGRIERILVEEGQKVRRGDTVAILSIPDIRAKAVQVEAAKSAAEAQNQKAIKGARSEQIASAYQMWQKAKAGLEIAQKSYDRIAPLYKQELITAQKYDEVLANLKAMQATEKAAASQYQMAHAGAEKEDKESAAALVERAQGALDEINSYVAESVLISPIDGEISEIFPMIGELVGTGAPIMNICDPSGKYITFNIREDMLKDIKMGAEISAYIPALDKNIKLKVTNIKNIGTYAAWKATKASGQYDIQTFEVKTKPNEAIEDLRPGMTVIIK